MDKKKKIMIGVGVVAAIGAYFLFFRKGSSDAEASVGAAAGLSIGVNQAKGNGDGKWLGIKRTSDRDIASSSLSLGTVASYNGSPCTVSKFWTDDKGRTGAVQCEEISSGNYNVPEGSSLSW